MITRPPINAVTHASILYVILMLTCMCLPFVAITGWKLNQDYLYLFHSQAVQATVLRKSNDYFGGGRGGSYKPALTYRYQVGGSAVDGYCAVSSETYDSVSTNGPLPIRYLTTQPDQNRIEMPSEVIESWFYTAVGVAVSAVLLTISVVGIKYNLKLRREYPWLLARGLPCQAAVTAINFTGWKGRPSNLCYIDFEFRDNAGRLISGRTFYLKRGDHMPWQVGSTLQVHYDPANSERFAVDLTTGPTNREGENIIKTSR